MTLWIGNGAFLKSSSQWQNKRILKINNSWPKLSNFQTIAAFDLVYSLLSSIYKYKPISTKPGHNVYEHTISDEFGSSLTRSVSVICP